MTPTATPNISTATPEKKKKKKPLFSFRDKGAAADKLEKRQKDSQQKKKFYQKEGYDKDEHSKNLARGLSTLSSSGESGESTASSGPASIGEAFQERKDRIEDEEKQRANAAQQKELMTRLRALTGGE